MEDYATKNKIGTLVGMVASLTAKVDKLLSSVGQSLPVVDFIVDAFDRADSDTLGTYWGNSTQFALRNGRAVPIQLPSNYIAIISGGGTYTGVAGYASPRIAQNGRSTAQYAAIMSSSAFNVAIDFDISTPVFTYVFSGQNSESYALASLVGVGVSSEGVSEEVILGVASTAAMSGTYVNGSITESTAAPAYVVSACTLNNTTGAGISLDVNSINVTTNSSTFGVINTPNTVSRYCVIGNNRLLMAVNGNSITIYLNGNVIYSGSPGFVISPNRINISSSGYSILGAITYLNSIFSSIGGPTLTTANIAGTFRLKAWVNTIPEPTNAQSGHGVIDASYPGGIMWMDKYHTLNRDSSGSMVGYSYNPAA